MTNQKYSADKQYIDSNVWQCQNSPTGAHYWIDEQKQKRVFTCKWCGEDKNFNAKK